MFILFVGVIIGNAAAIGILIVDHLLWLRYWEEDGSDKTHVGYGSYLAIKHLIKRSKEDDDRNEFLRQHFGGGDNKDAK